MFIIYINYKYRTHLHSKVDLDTIYIYYTYVIFLEKIVSAFLCTDNIFL